MSHARIVAFLVASAAGALAVGGCSVVGDDAESSEADDTIHPKDGETLGNVVVHRPPAGAVMGFAVQIDGQDVTPETPFRVTEGTHVLSLAQVGADWNGLDVPQTVYRRVDVKKQETTDVNLSAMTFGFVPGDLADGDLNVLAPSALKLTLDNKPFPHDCGARKWECKSGNYDCSLWEMGGTCWSWVIKDYSVKGTYDTFQACDSACAKNSIYGPLNATCTQPSDKVCDQPEIETLVDTKNLKSVFSGTSSSAIALLGGSYTVTTSSGTVGVTLSPGAFQVVNQGAHGAAHGNVVVTPPTSRDMPNARNDQLTLKLDGEGRNTMVVDTRSTYTVKAVGFDNGATTNLAATLGPRTIRLAVHDGETTPLTLGRIDMDDVTVKREDGTTYLAHGNYTVTCITDGAAIGSFATKTGIDVLPGDYRVDLTYSTAEGPKSQTFRLHF